MDSKFWSDMGKAVAIAAVTTVVSRCIIYSMDTYYNSTKDAATPEGDAPATATTEAKAEEPVATAAEPANESTVDAVA